ncbi:MAG TPA: hypothetical protein VGB22_01930 [candidate division Zixibacteria bacterium]|jgi:hypothetical protein
MSVKSAAAALAVVLATSVSTASAGDVPRLLNYQGRLADTAGRPLPDSSYDVGFRLFNDPVMGTLLWEETHSVTTVAGVFAVLLGSLDSIPEFVFYLDSIYLEIEPESSDPLVPRSRLVMVPYAWRSHDADKVGGYLPLELEESAEIDNDIALHAAIPDAHHPKTISASELIIGTLSEARLPQGAIDSTEIELESIPANRLVDEPGIAHTFNALKSLSTTVSVIDSAVITVPKGGYMVVMANGWFYKFHTSGSGDTYSTVSISTLRTAHDINYSAKFSVLSASPTGHVNENFMVSRVMTIGSGQTKIFLIGDLAGVVGARVENVHLNTFYFPTAYGDVDLTTR